VTALDTTTGVITAEGERALRDRLAELEREHREEFVARLREARAFGDPGVNDELLQIREEEAVLASRIARLRDLLATVRVIPDDQAFDGRVGIGTRVEVEDVEAGVNDEFVITDGQGQPLQDAVSAGSPVGRALLGNGPGAEVTVDLPAGRARRMRILAVRGPRES
jgi:transcription elongation factor GreA